MAWYIPHVMETCAISLKLASNVVFHSHTELREQKVSFYYTLM